MSFRSIEYDCPKSFVDYVTENLFTETLGKKCSNTFIMVIQMTV